MCSGLPMTIIASDGDTATCVRQGLRRQVSLALIGDQAPGTRVLVRADTAVRTLEADEADVLDWVVEGLAVVARSRPAPDFFADLAGRQPARPDMRSIAAADRA